MIQRLPVPALLLAMLAACGQDVTPPDPPATDDGNATAQPSAPAPAAGPTASGTSPGAQPMLLREGDPGHLADGSGAALYYLEGNHDGSRCDTACEQVWPPVKSEDANPVAAPGVNQSAVATVQGQGAGGNHVTYHGHPLYRYAGDRGARTTTGDDVEDQWGRWRLMGVDGQAAGTADDGATN